MQPQAKWLLAEGADSAHMSRSIPIEKALDDAMIALYQNGERLRPEQGYPVRLLLPGWEGNMNVKWLRRIKVTEAPTYTKDETSKYTDLLPDGRALQFTFEMGVKSVITKPSSTMTLPRHGLYEISGIAWSGAGRIRRVEVSTDGGATWADAALYRRGASEGPGALSLALGMDRQGGGAAKPRHRREGAGAAGAQRVARAVLAGQYLSQQFHRELGGGRRREREKCLRLNAYRSRRNRAARSRPARASRIRAGKAPALGVAGERGGNRALGHQHSAERRRLAAGQRQRQAGRSGVCGEMPGLPRRERRRQAGRSTGRRHRHRSRRKAPVRTVGSYWPYATTLFDYVRRAMPITNPLSLTNDEVYAVSAYVLNLNGIVPAGRGDERADAAAGEDAEPRRVYRYLEKIIIQFPPP